MRVFGTHTSAVQTSCVPYKTAATQGFMDLEGAAHGHVRWTKETEGSAAPRRRRIAEQVAVAVGTTLGHLSNRKDALVSQLSSAEATIVDVSRRAGDRIKAYVSSSMPGVGTTRTAKPAKARRPSTRGK